MAPSHRAEEDSEGAEVKINVNLRSIDAMFARVLTEARGLKEYVSDRLDRQDTMLGELKNQGSSIRNEFEKRLVSLEDFKNTTKGKIAGMVFILTPICTVIAIILDKILEHAWK
jgi:hypothetical protein